MAHLSEDKGLITAFESGEDLHSTVASQVFGVKAADRIPTEEEATIALSANLNTNK